MKKKHKKKKKALVWNSTWCIEIFVPSFLLHANSYELNHYEYFQLEKLSIYKKVKSATTKKCQNNQITNEPYSMIEVQILETRTTI